MTLITGKSLPNGIAVIHANRLEELCHVVKYWLEQHPLPPLAQELLLVQSNGMGQWLKQNLAKNSELGIAAGIKIQLPSSFIWSVYHTVLGEQIPDEQPLAREPLIWRLYRLLPILKKQSGFESLANFLKSDVDAKKNYQLAVQLAELFDQYQVYRSDWLNDWADGKDSWLDAKGIDKGLPTHQRWQANLWRAILADVGPEQSICHSRAAVHRQFMSAMANLEERPAGLPQRVILFGLSSLPQQTLEALARLGRFCQIILFVHNPCRHYWADIIEDKDLLKAVRRRQVNKPGLDGGFSLDQLYTQVSSLLAAWGKQGRDYIRLLDQFDETPSYKDWGWPQDKIDLFSDYGDETGNRNLLQALQQSILDLEPVPESPMELAEVDHSIEFHIAHSRQRELEILHDQLLARFAEAKNKGQPLLPREIIVMVPDIDQYAPHIRAVFGQFDCKDHRHIPFTLSDQQQRSQNPLLLAVESLLKLTESRFTVSEILCLLEVDALRNRFGIDVNAITRLHQWISEAGIRWGLNAEQRKPFVDTTVDLSNNTWQFGLERMLLGYAVGESPSFNGIVPYDEIAGLEANYLGGLAYLLETLERYQQRLAQLQDIDAWQQTLLGLLKDFFVASSDVDRKTLEILKQSLEKWLQYCRLAKLTASDRLPIKVVSEAWLSMVDQPSLHQRFLGGRVNFCTLMPMRAIPFRVICLLGMNDGDYPRNVAANGFDLMSCRGMYRPGDRSRRQDDQYLFLEALLSAREQFYISWIGRSVRDNSKRPPSVLVGQLRDVIAQSWQLPDKQPILEAVTVEHPLQPFSQRYLNSHPEQRLFTYAREWFVPAAVQNSDQTSSRIMVATAIETVNLSLVTLARFLRAPVKIYCQHTLKLRFDEPSVSREDSEPFALDKLQAFSLSEELLFNLQTELPDDIDSFLSERRQIITSKGQLPWAGFASTVFDPLADSVKQTWQAYQLLLADWPNELPAQPLIFSFPMAGTTVQVSGELLHLRQNQEGAHGLIYQTANQLLDKDIIKLHVLWGAWLQHLAACAAGFAVQTLIVAADAVIQIQPIEQNLARDCLEQLVAAYQQGIKAPLPVACKTALVWLRGQTSQPPNQHDVMSCYQGDDWHSGEVDYDPYLARFFPSFADLHSTAKGEQDFEYWAGKLYQLAVSSFTRWDRAGSV